MPIQFGHDSMQRRPTLKISPHCLEGSGAVAESPLERVASGDAPVYREPTVSRPFTLGEHGAIWELCDGLLFSHLSGASQVLGLSMCDGLALGSRQMLLLAAASCCGVRRLRKTPTDRHIDTLTLRSHFGSSS